MSPKTIPPREGSPYFNVSFRGIYEAEAYGEILIVSGSGVQREKEKERERERAAVSLHA